MAIPVAAEGRDRPQREARLRLCAIHRTSGYGRFQAVALVKQPRANPERFTASSGSNMTGGLRGRLSRAGVRVMGGVGGPAAQFIKGLMLRQEDLAAEGLQQM